MHKKPKCIIILSTKSSGSSALQYYIRNIKGVNLVEHTRHFENETLFWTKAASILGKPQVNMVDSEIPLPAGRAKKDLTQFLVKNTKKDFSKFPDYDLIFKGWEALCHAYKPVLLEKSPHHLLQWSSIELIAEAVDTLDSIDFFIIGLIRNPLDVLYSHWTRWWVYPDQKEHELLIEHENLWRCKDIFQDKFYLIRYEDYVKDNSILEPVKDFIYSGTGNGTQDFFELHSRSIHKWKNDRSFRYQLSDETIKLYKRYGYSPEELQWSGEYSPLSHIVHSSKIFSRKILKNIKFTVRNSSL